MSKGSREATESTEGATLRMGAAERHSPYTLIPARADQPSYTHAPLPAKIFPTNPS